MTLTLTNVTPLPRRAARTRRWRPNSALAAIRAFEHQHDRLPNPCELATNATLPNTATLVELFGSAETAMAQARLQRNDGPVPVPVIAASPGQIAVENRLHPEPFANWLETRLAESGGDMKGLSDRTGMNERQIRTQIARTYANVSIDLVDRALTSYDGEVSINDLYPMAVAA